jgi:hypothetical protein
MFRDQVDPKEVHKEIAFGGDPITLITLANDVTFRMARDGEDKYDELSPGDPFNLLLIGDQGVTTNLGVGQVVAHWKLPFNEIPDEILCGEEFFPECFYRNRPGFRVRERMKKNLSHLYRSFEPKKELHAIVFAYPDEITEKIVENFPVPPVFISNPDLFVREYLSESFLQREGETPEEWISRGSNLHEDKTLADVFFGFKNSYKALKGRI